MYFHAEIIRIPSVVFIWTRKHTFATKSVPLYQRINCNQRHC